jgi:hypothetical protein
MLHTINYKKFVIIAAAALICLISQDAGYLIKASDLQDKYRQIQNLTDMVTAYHDNVNKIFNKKIELVRENKGNSTKPTTDDVCRTDMANVTTYCLGVLTIDEFSAFQKEFLSRKSKLPNESLSAIKNYNFEVVTQMTSSQADFISKTLEESGKTLDLAIEAYDQFRVAYPMHLKYLDIIDELETYNNKMAELEDYSKLWPGKFIDASTTDCT